MYTTMIESTLLIVWLGLLKKAGWYKSIVCQEDSYLKELVRKRTCGFQGGRLILSCVTKSVLSGEKPYMRNDINKV